MSTQRIHDGADCYPWRPVFAVWPVRTASGQWVWLRRIYKRRFWVMWGKHGIYAPKVEYAEIFYILANPD